MEFSEFRNYWTHTENLPQVITWSRLPEYVAGIISSESYIEGITLIGTDLVFTGKNSGFTGTIDLSSIGTILYEELTRAELNTRISTSSLKPGQWYLVNDYKTTKEIVQGSGVFYEAAPEEIYLLALSTSNIAEKGYSKTFDKDIITYDQNRIIKTQEISFFKDIESGVVVDSDGVSTITPISAVSFTIAGVTIPTFSDLASWDLEISDYIGGGSANISVNNNGVVSLTNLTDYTYDALTQTFTLIGTSNIDLLTNSGDFYIGFTAVANDGTYEKGLIIAREVPDINLVIRSDFRGTKVRRYKADVPTWTAGTYNEGDVVRHIPTQAIYCCIATGVVSEPNSSPTEWMRTIDDSRHLMVSSINAKGFNIPIDFGNFVDVPMIEDISLCSNSFISTSNLEDPYKELDIYIPADFQGIRNSTLFCDGANTILGLLSSTINFCDSNLIEAITNSNINVLTNSFINDIRNSNILEMTNTIVADIIEYSTIKRITDSFINGRFIYNNVGEADSYGLYFGNFYYNTINYIVATNMKSTFNIEYNTFNSIVSSSIEAAIINSLYTIIDTATISSPVNGQII